MLSPETFTRVNFATFLWRAVEIFMYAKSGEIFRRLTFIKHVNILGRVKEEQIDAIFNILMHYCQNCLKIEKYYVHSKKVADLRS